MSATITNLRSEGGTSIAGSSSASPDRDTSSATWKFEFENTVNADPRAGGACLKVIRVYLNFANKAKPEAFCSMANLMLLTGSSAPTCRKAKAKLEHLGYLVPRYETSEGATMYRLVNARKDMIDQHIQIGREAIAAEKRLRKKLARKARGGEKGSFPPKDDLGERNFPPVEKESFPNTVEEYRRDSCSEGREGLVEGNAPSSDNPYAMVDDDPTVPFDVPSSEEEAEETFAEILAHVGNVNPIIKKALRSMFMSGNLSPALLTANLGGGHDR